MSVENVKLFYARLAVDETFEAQVKSAKSKEECTQIVRAAGYDFTTQELEDYTAQMMNPSDELSDLDRAELETVLGGFKAFVRRPFPGPIVQPLYGVIWPPEIQ